MYIMSSYAPPTENVPVFDAGLFRGAGGDPLSEEYLRTIFLQYPIAQTGLETLSETKTTGQSEFNGTMTNTSVIPYPDNTTKVPTTAWVNLAVAGGSGSLLGTNNVWTGTNQFQSTTTMLNNLSMNSITAIANRQITSSYYNFYATNNVATLTYSGRFYGNLNSIVYDCPDTSLTGSSSHIFYNYNGASVLNSLTISNTGITNNTVQPASNDSTNIVPTTAWVQSAISAGATPTTTTLKYTSNATFNTPTGCRFIDIQVIGAGGSQGVSDVGPPVFYGGAGSGGNMASITGFAITANTSLTLSFVAGDTTGYVQISYTGASVLTNIAKVYNGNGGQPGSIGNPAAGASSNSTASVIASRSASAYVYAGTAGLGSTLSGGGSSIPPATAGTGTSCPNGCYTYQNGLFGCGGTGTTNKGGGLIVITYHLGV